MSDDVRAAIDELDSLLYNDFLREHIRIINRGKLYGLSEEVQTAMEETLMNLCELVRWRFTQARIALNKKENADE